MAVRRSALVDERALGAEYPFLPGSETLVAELAPSLRELLTDPSYARARELGRARILAAVEDPTGARRIEELDVAPPEERFLSFAYARLLLSASASAAPLRRWAVAEAKRSYARLEGAPVEELVEVARRLELTFRPSEGRVRIALPDYLRLAAAIREADFRLIHQTVDHGDVEVERTRAARLLQEGIRRRIGIGTELSAEVRSAIESSEAGFLQEVQLRVPIPTARVDSGTGPLREELFPPCIRKMRRMLQAGENLSHSGRFALAAFLHRAGATYETIVDAYRGAPDFDEGVTRYQVEHITQRDGGRGYEPPECATLRTHGLCFREGDPTAAAPADRAPDPRCFDPKLRHPVQYYRWRGGSVPERGARDPDGAGAAGSDR